MLESKKPLSNLLQRVVKGYDFPVLDDADFGHTDPMIVLPNGVQASIQAENGKATFSITEAATV